jgi:[acyl-carrier-protein] S-malonyltransferase
MSIAFVFPGQGSQTVGMGRALAAASPAAARVFEDVDAALSEPLSRLIWEGPEDELTLTANAQPALMAVSLAVVAALAEAGVEIGRDVAYVAGHSLGEYSALAAAGSLPVAETAKLLRLRGRAMQEAVAPGVGAMAALLGLDRAAAEEVAALAADGEVSAVANDNAPGQCVVSGHRGAVERAMEIARGRGARRPMLLPVSAPFHCPLMAPAAERMRAALSAADLAAPSVPLVANVTAAPVGEPDAIRRFLVEQVTATVRWRESIEWLARHGVDHIYEIGAGRVLTGLMKRIDGALAARAVGGPDDVAAAAGEILALAASGPSANV